MPSNALYSAKEWLKNSLADIRQRPANALVDTVRGGLLGATTDAVGYIPDAVADFMRPFGYNVAPQDVVGGTEWLANRVARPTNSLAENAARFTTGMLTPSPMDFARLGKPVKADAIYPDALDDKQKQNFHNWFRRSKATDANGQPLVVYHGAQRADRIGDRFQKKRATSGPMAFFTDDPGLASSYATGKMDTSLEVNDYADWFQYKPPGGRTPRQFTVAWWYMTPEQREAAKQALYRIGKDEETGAIRIDPESNLVSKDHIDFVMREKRGNALEAAKDIWLDSGNLFDDEDKFVDVLKSMGVSGVEPNFPNVPRSGVFASYLSVQNPLDTSVFSSGAPGSTELYAALEKAGKRKQAKMRGGADQWDKRTVSGSEWLERLRGDMANGTTHAWTSIPDWVTEELKRLGYDGIKDVSGKGGGPAHAVWIPFDETQVKSALGNKGTFDTYKKSITK